MKYHGLLGLVEEVELPPESGEFIEQATEYTVYGDILSARSSRRDTGTNIDTYTLNNRFSLLVGRDLLDKQDKFRYLVVNKSKWEISDIELQYPRVILSLGGVYNG